MYLLHQQTKFLLDKQKEVLQFFNDEFQSLYALLKAEQEQSEKVRAGSRLTSFSNVFSLLSYQEKRSIKQLEEDIAFLEEQLGAINEIKKSDDQEKKEELTQMMLEDDHQLADTEEFQIDIEKETELTKKNFKVMMNDIKAVLIDEGIEELEIILEAHAVETEKEDEIESQDEGEDESSSGFCNEKCHEKNEKTSAPNSCCNSCNSRSGYNIFEGINEKK